MNIVCAICSELLLPADDVFSTTCGHIFHFLCITQWLERSKTCPQCRERTTENKIYRIYFNLSNNDSFGEDTAVLNDKLDKLNFQLLLKTNELKQSMEKVETLEKQNAGLRQEVKKVESELHSTKSATYALKEQIKYLKHQCSDAQSVREENAQLRKDLQDRKNMQTLLTASAEDVDEMISQISDPSTFCTYISVMKREMSTSQNKRRLLRERVKALELQLAKMKAEHEALSNEIAKRKQLEEQLVTCESEKLSLESELEAFKTTMAKLIKDKPANKTATAPVPGPSEENECEIEEIKEIKVEVIEKKKKLPEPKKGNEILTIGECTLSIPEKSQDAPVIKVNGIQRRATANLSSSILAKKPRLHQMTERANHTTNDIAYDGFGGHSKVDKFPNPSFGMKGKTSRDDLTKQKKPKLDTGDNLKLDFFMRKN